jgi:hypothetical protein
MKRPTAWTAIIPVALAIAALLHWHWSSELEQNDQLEHGAFC